ncbi:MAG: diguanylate cyclase [Anaerolineales bacterium]|nr:diguanylate cyclase [Anaerolineales bacterium]
MRNTDLDAAQAVTKKVIELMEEYSFTFPKGKDMKLGITAGIAVYPTHASNPSDMIRAADSALYHAKKHYRGQFVTAKGATGRLDPIQVKET